MSELPHSKRLAKTIARIRRERSWTVDGLAARCADLGYPTLDAQVIEGYESDDRVIVISVDELCCLAVALDVPPVRLLMPEPDESLAVTPTIDLTYDRAWEFFTGLSPIDTRALVPLPEHVRQAIAEEVRRQLPGAPRTPRFGLPL